MAAPAPIPRDELDSVVAPFGSSTGLPSSAYTGSDVFEWERRRFFHGGWFCVGRTDDLLESGQARAVVVCGEGVLLTRAADGKITAFTNTCRHRGHELLPEGPAAAVRWIRCPYHSWTYGLDGALSAAPKFPSHDSFDAADFPLNSIPVAEWAGWLFVNVDGTASSLREHLGNLTDLLDPYAPQSLVGAGSGRYQVDANWKIVVENYSECYHCSSIHPALCEITPPNSGTDVTPTGLWCGGTMDLKEHAATMSMDGTSPLAPLPGLDDRARRTVFYAAVFGDDGRHPWPALHGHRCDLEPGHQGHDRRGHQQYPQPVKRRR